jgi:hypothetical protein
MRNPSQRRIGFVLAIVLGLSIAPLSCLARGVYRDGPARTFGGLAVDAHRLGMIDGDTCVRCLDWLGDTNDRPISSKPQPSK